MKKKNEIISPTPIYNKKKKCLSCGAALEKSKRRYCSKQCKDLLLFALRWLKNLLLVLNTNYATFSFSKYLLIVNILPYRSKEVFSFFFKRTLGKAPSEDLKTMCVKLSRDWYNENKRTNCRALASISLLKKGQKGGISKDLIKPMIKKSKSGIKKQLISLKLSFEDIDTEGSKEKIKAAYRKEAMKTHPDVGGDEDKFKIISEAYQELTEWLNRPAFIIGRGVPGKWSYDGRCYKWRPPL